MYYTLPTSEYQRNCISVESSVFAKVRSCDADQVVIGANSDMGYFLSYRERGSHVKNQGNWISVESSEKLSNNKRKFLIYGSSSTTVASQMHISLNIHHLCFLLLSPCISETNPYRTLRPWGLLISIARANLQKIVSLTWFS